MNATERWKHFIQKMRKANSARSQWECFKACNKLSINTPGTLKDYHDALLFLCVYPFGKKVFDTAIKELDRLVQIGKKHKHNKQWQYVLSNSGISFTKMRCQYSIDLIQWMLEKFPEQVKPSGSEEPGEAIQMICGAALPGVEFHLSNHGNWNTWNRIKSLSRHYHNADALRWLLQLFNQQSWHPILRDHLYDSLKIFASWDLNDNIYSRTYLRWPASSIYYHKKMIRRVNPVSIVRRPLAKQKSLQSEEKNDLISVIRSSLAFYQRETDPVTYADPAETFLFDMGEGMQIALTGMKPDRRLSIESYVGFMAFKNGVPIAYGGGWLFGYLCEIGVNIYSPFRGGESEKLFCQVLRLYYQHFNVRKFIVKPYQFGKGNPEGLKSGAFWFYHKLGFRPVKKKIKKMVDEEWKKIRRDKNHRTPLSLLKTFATSNVEWEVVKNKTFFIDADEISKSVTKMINEKFGGDREKALKSCLHQVSILLGRQKIPVMNAVEKKVWQNWSLIFCSLQFTKKWNKKEQKKVLHLLRAKAKMPEREFIIILQRYQAFWSAVKKNSY